MSIFWTQFVAAALLRCLVALLRMAVDRFFPDRHWGTRIAVVGCLSLPIMALAAYALAVIGDGTLDLLAVLMGALAADFALSFWRPRKKEAKE